MFGIRCGRATLGHKVGPVHPEVIQHAVNPVVQFGGGGTEGDFTVGRGVIHAHPAIGGFKVQGLANAGFGIVVQAPSGGGKVVSCVSGICEVTVAEAIRVVPGMMVVRHADFAPGYQYNHQANPHPKPHR